MTEKRFYYNTFYHADDMSRVLEYEIIDRQSYPNYPNHDEKEDIPNWYIYIDENDSGWQDMLVELLNALHEENEQLKKELKKYTDAFDCSQCRFQNYDWFDDGDEFEVCEKGNNEAQMENHSCSEWEEI